MLRDEVMPDGFHIKGLQTVPCLQPGDPGLNVMLSIIKRRLLKACCAACVVARRLFCVMLNHCCVTTLCVWICVDVALRIVT